MSTHEYRRGATGHSGALWRIASTRIATKWGMFAVISFERDIWNGGRKTETTLALVMGDLSKRAALVRIHSLGELLGSLRDCRNQLQTARQAIAEEGRGL